MMQKQNHLRINQNKLAQLSDGEKVCSSNSSQKTKAKDKLKSIKKKVFSCSLYHYQYTSKIFIIEYNSVHPSKIKIQNKNLSKPRIVCHSSERYCENQKFKSFCRTQPILNQPVKCFPISLHVQIQIINPNPNPNHQSKFKSKSSIQYIKVSLMLSQR